MKYFIKQDQGFVPCDIRAEDHRLLIKIGEKEYRVALKQLPRNLYSVIIDQQSYLVEAVREGKKISIVKDHLEKTVQIFNERQKIASEIFGAVEHDTGEGDIRAPMPGMILRIEVQSGQEIEAGQSLLIMEAMKMENEIRSDINGVVKEVLIRPQQAVEKDDLLIRIGPEE